MKFLLRKKIKWLGTDLYTVPKYDMCCLHTDVSGIEIETVLVLDNVTFLSEPR